MPLALHLSQGREGPHLSFDSAQAIHALAVRDRGVFCDVFKRLFGWSLLWLIEWRLRRSLSFINYERCGLKRATNTRANDLLHTSHVNGFSLVSGIT